MKILRIAQHLYPEVTGGAPYHVHAMSRDQARMGHDVTVLTVSPDETLARREERDGYEVIRSPPQFEVLGNSFTSGIWREMKQHRDYDVIHAHGHYYFSTKQAALRRLLDSIPLAVTNHGLYSQSAPEGLFRAYLRTLGRWTFNRSDLSFCYTEADRHRLQQLGVTTPIEVIPNGVDRDRFSPDGPTSELIECSGPAILFVGRLVEGKRPKDVVRAVQGMDESVSLFLCGDGPLDEDLRRMADDRCTLVGSVPYERMPDIYRSADALVLPSRAEGVPRTIMEALACGVPVVSSDLPQVRSAFGERITYFDPGDVDGLGRAISDAISSSSTSQSDERFQWERTVAETTDCLASIATTNGTTSG